MSAESLTKAHVHLTDGDRDLPGHRTRAGDGVPVGDGNRANVLSVRSPGPYHHRGSPLPLRSAAAASRLAPGGIKVVRCSLGVVTDGPGGARVPRPDATVLVGAPGLAVGPRRLPTDGAARSRREAASSPLRSTAAGYGDAVQDTRGDIHVAQRVLVVGQGYVGLLLAMRSVEVGDDVTGYDVDGRKIAECAVDDRTWSMWPTSGRAGVVTGRYHRVDDASRIRDFDVAVITVPTPLTDGVPDLSHVEAAAAMLGPRIRPACTVVLESRRTRHDRRVGCAGTEAASGLKAGIDFHVGYSPERIDPGNREWTLVTTPKVVAGLTPASLAAVDAFYSRLVDRTVSVGSTRVAELTKLLENTFRHVNIALVNELAVNARALGIECGKRSTPPQPSRSGSCRSPGPRCWRPLPSYRSVVPVVAVRAPTGRLVALRRDRQRHQSPHARLCRAASTAGSQS